MGQLLQCAVLMVPSARCPLLSFTFFFSGGAVAFLMLSLCPDFRAMLSALHL